MPKSTTAPGCELRSYIDIVRVILRNCADPDALDHNSKSPMCTAINAAIITAAIAPQFRKFGRDRWFDMIRLLLSYGASSDRTVKGTQFRTPVALAIERGMDDVATKMLRQGQVDAVAKTSALLAAMASTNENMIQLLI